MWGITENIYLGNSGDGKAHAQYEKKNGVYVFRENPEFITFNAAIDLDVPADIHIGFHDNGNNPQWKVRAAVSALNQKQYI